MPRLLVLAILCALTTTAAADEVARVRSHLRGARTLLDARDLSELSASQRENRLRAIAVLDGYIERGEFPRRTSDAYGPLRPRFIDDRGVHCAVGEMIARTGFEALATEINQRYEFAFVRDIHSEKLVAWATDYGFTVDELAAIQPTYKRDSTREQLDSKLRAITRLTPHLSEIALSCIDDAPMPAQVELESEIDTHQFRKANIKSKTADAFSTCFAAAANRYLPYTSFTGTLEFALLPFDQLLERHLREAACIPSKGPIPKKAILDFSTGTVRTEPSSSDSETCLALYVDRTVGSFHRHAQLTATIELVPHVSNDRAHVALVRAAIRYGWKCAAYGDPAEIRIDVRAREGDSAFKVTLPGANERFASCMATKIEAEMQGLVAPIIDGDIDDTLTFKLVHTQ